MARIVFLDCFSGASGGMLLGALLDAGYSLDDLRADLACLQLSHYEIKTCVGIQKGIKGTKFDVIDLGKDRPARNLRAIEGIIGPSSLSPWVKHHSLAVLARLAEAEAAVRGITIEEVYFRELGAVDSLVDIVGFVSGLERMGIQEVYASPLALGSGTVETEHDLMPAPAPATLHILASANAPVRPTSAAGDLLTPTGAVLLVHFATFSRPAMRIERVGYGLGTKELPWANVLRAWVGTRQGPVLTTDRGMEQDEVMLLECNLDDATGETLGYVMERVLDGGALDVWFTPIQMKKNRPAVMLSVLCMAADCPGMEWLIMQETTTLGVRVRPVQRIKAARRQEKVLTPWGVVRVKVKLLDGAPLSVSPEYEDCARLALAAGLPLQEVVLLATKTASDQFLNPSPKAG